MLGTKRNPSFFSDSVEKEEVREVRHKVKKEDRNNFFDDDVEQEYIEEQPKARPTQRSSFYDEVDDDDYYEEEPQPKRRNQRKTYDDFVDDEYEVEEPKPKPRKKQPTYEEVDEEYYEEIEPKKVKLKTNKAEEIPPSKPPKPPQNQRLGMENRNHTMFHKATQKESFSDIVKRVQVHISNDYAELITGNASDSKEQMKRYIGKFIFDNQLAVEGKTTDQLIADIYTEMAEFGFLTKYIYGTGIEEIDINSWQDIEIQYSNGTTKKTDEHFDSPEHAVNVIRRMLHISGIVLDNASPVVLGHLSKNIRIAVMKYPIVDEDDSGIIMRIG